MVKALERDNECWSDDLWYLLKRPACAPILMLDGFQHCMYR